MADRPLTAQQQRFVDEYLVDLNAAQAAIRAGYSARTAYTVGPRQLRKPQIAAAVAAAQAKRSERTGITADVVLHELLRLARVDIGDAFTPDGKLRPLAEMPEDVRRAIAGIEVEAATERRGELTKIKLWDKPRALELLGKHLKLFTEKIEVDAKVQSAVVAFPAEQ